MAAFLKPNWLKLAFLVEWPFYLLYTLLCGQLREPGQILPVLFAALCFYLAACFLFAGLAGRRGLGELKTLLAWALSLACLDQALKLAIYRLAPLGRSFPLLPGILHLSHAQNRYSSWLMTELEWQFVDQAGLAAVSLLALGLGILLYRYYSAVKRRSPWADLALLMLFAGLLSSLSDQVIWGLTVDFLQLPGHFVADGKDLYLAFGTGALVAEAAASRSLSWQVDLREVAREISSFFRFTWADFRKVWRIYGCTRGKTMKEFFTRFSQVILHPDSFFEGVCQEKRWSPPLLHLFFLALWLSLGSVIAWGAGVAGDTPLNSALGAQMDIYPYWRETLLPQYGFWSYPLAMGLIMLEMFVITFIWTPVVFLVFRYLGGRREPGGLLRAFQGFVYGLTPCALGGFLPFLGIVTGVWATLLQFQRGPAITLKNRTFVPYLFLSLFLSYAIWRYWQHGLL